MPFHPLLNGIGELAQAPLENLRNIDWLSCAIRRTGLSGEAKGYDEWDRAYCLGKHEGIFQHPIELATYLVRLSREKITSYLEIGTWAGWTCAFTTAYLLRFQRPFTALTIDPAPRLDPEWHHIESILPLKHLLLTSASLRDRTFDLVFIDGEHTYHSSREDYDNVGQQARICGFHDIHERWVVQNCPDGGCVRLWQELKAENGKQAEEICCHNDPECMGIGVLFQGGFAQIIPGVAISPYPMVTPSS